MGQVYAFSGLRAVQALGVLRWLMPKQVKHTQRRKRTVRTLAELARLQSGPGPFEEVTLQTTVTITPAQISAYMAKLGSKGGKVSGAKRMEMPKKDRIAIAKKAAAARWSNKKGK